MNRNRESSDRPISLVTICLVLLVDVDELSHKSAMTWAGKIVLRVVFVIICMTVVLISDYSGMLNRFLGMAVANQEPAGNGRPPPRPTNPGYGDTKTDIDLDADIEDDSLRNFGKDVNCRISKLF